MDGSSVGTQSKSAGLNARQEVEEMLIACRQKATWSKGKKVTLAVICRMMAWISFMMSCRGGDEQMRGRDCTERRAVCLSTASRC